ncbi:hypothetical protein U9M48_020363 [Paspalum notatum var. saurae]|uniref:Uncharacterized protein n=1 Tax=Paspalum notatum var. saurae TaxID=547442 RepID=A0AAQ3TE56_PASNO
MRSMATSRLHITCALLLIGADENGGRRMPSLLSASGLRDLLVLRLREAPGELQLLPGPQRLHAPSLRRDAANLLLTPKYYGAVNEVENYANPLRYGFGAAGKSLKLDFFGKALFVLRSRASSGPWAGRHGGVPCPQICVAVDYVTCPSSGSQQLPAVCNCCMTTKGCTLHLSDGTQQSC